MLNNSILSAEVKVRKLQVRVMVPNLATPTQASSLIFIYFNNSFRCLLVRVSGKMKKRGYVAVAGISFSFGFINFC